MSTERAGSPRIPDPASEARLLEIKRQGEVRGKVEGRGIRPAGAPFPKASPETGYYGIHLLKEPQWTPEIPLYFFVGGVAGSAAVIGAAADWLGKDPKLAQSARWVAFGGGLASTALLIHDLGRPSRFLNMLRVFKVQSPMSVGAWTLAAFGGSTAAALFAKTIEQRFGSRYPDSPDRQRRPVLGGCVRFAAAQLHRCAHRSYRDSGVEQEHHDLADPFRHVGRAGRSFAAGTDGTW